VRQIVDRLEKYIDSKQNNPKYLLLQGEGLMVKMLLSKISQSAAKRGISVLDKFPPPLVGVYGGALFGQSAKNLKGRFKLFNEEDSIFGVKGLFDLGMVPLSVGIEVEGVYLHKVLHAF
jgi:hypothetical protein